MAKQLVLLTYTPRELSEEEYAKFIAHTSHVHIPKEIILNKCLNPLNLNKIEVFKAVEFLCIVASDCKRWRIASALLIGLNVVKQKRR